MKRPRIRVGRWALLVAVLAVNFAGVGYVVATAKDGIRVQGAEGFLLVVAPLVDVLILGLPRLIGGRAGRLLVGFEATGWGLVLAYGVGCVALPGVVSRYFLGTWDAAYNALAARSALGHPLADGFYMGIVMFPASSVVAALPLGLVAAAGGALGLWLEAVSEHHRPGRGLTAPSRR